MLLLLFVGLFLLRFADRAFLALLFHDPPRMTRLPEPRAASPWICRDYISIATSSLSRRRSPSVRP